MLHFFFINLSLSTYKRFRAHIGELFFVMAIIS